MKEQSLIVNCSLFLGKLRIRKYNIEKGILQKHTLLNENKDNIIILTPILIIFVMNYQNQILLLILSSIRICIAIAILILHPIRGPKGRGVAPIGAIREVH